MFDQYNILTSEECSFVREKILSLRRHWVNRTHGMLPFYTLGAASYMDASIDDDSYYKSKAAKMNPVLETNFKFIYDRILILLSEKLKRPCSYESELALPGFHIFEYSKVFEQPVASTHFDLQFQLHKWDKYKEVDRDNPLSFTCAIDLPSAGSGLNYWDIFYSDSLKMGPEEFDHFVATKEQHYFPYEKGKMVVHHGMIMHQIAPSKDMTLGDRRITLQGHGILADGEFRLYW